MKKQILTIYVSVVILSLLLSSCASVFSKGNRTVTIDGSSKEPVTIITKKKTYENVTFPAKVQIAKRKVEGQIIRVKSGDSTYKDIVLHKKFRAGAICNLVVWPAWIIDCATNNIVGPSKKYYYFDSPNDLYAMSRKEYKSRDNLRATTGNFMASIPGARSKSPARTNVALFGGAAASTMGGALASNNTPAVPAAAAKSTEEAAHTPTVDKVEKLTSDVDINIPTIAAANKTTFAVIIANENYQSEVKVEYAINDGEMFQTYCNKVLGIPSENIHFTKDATLNNVIAEIDWIQRIANAYNGEASFIVYYAGHGIPDEATGQSYLLPVDGKGAILRTAYSLKEFYQGLGNLAAKNVTVFMDACFSGSKRGDGMLMAARGVAIKAKEEAPVGNLVVFSAAQSDETAYPYKDKKHGLFTYYLLKKLQETKGEATLGELSDYIGTQVSRKSIVSNGKSQTPSTSTQPHWQTPGKILS